MIPPAVSRAWAERAASLFDWLDAQGTDLRYRPAYGAASFKDSTHGNTTNRSRLRSSATIRQGHRYIHRYASADHHHGQLVADVEAQQPMLHFAHVVNQLPVNGEQQISHQNSCGSRGRELAAGGA